MEVLVKELDMAQHYGREIGLLGKNPSSLNLSGVK